MSRYDFRLMPDKPHDGSLSSSSSIFVSGMEVDASIQPLHAASPAAAQNTASGPYGLAVLAREAPARELAAPGNHAGGLPGDVLALDPNAAAADSQNMELRRIHQ